ncbi:MAG: hypothetical protein CMJ76_06190 [Planctomycetaceae bacterium]|mgnify:CR=1 FL=1|nr:hypothetical protein [Planctomycetaceae bacterium]|tara:strand:+ start:1666 stop:1848 length:183 start_codon:yes stop_codon:yes gene_type:complete
MKILTLIVLTASLTVFGCGTRKTDPPPEVDTEVSDLEIDFGDEFLPFDEDVETVEIGIGE